MKKMKKCTTFTNAKVDFALGALSSIGQIADAFAKGDEKRAKKHLK